MSINYTVPFSVKQARDHLWSGLLFAIPCIFLASTISSCKKHVVPVWGLLLTALIKVVREIARIETNLGIVLDRNDLPDNLVEEVAIM